MIPWELKKTVRLMGICAIFELICIIGAIVTSALCFEVLCYGSNKYVSIPLLCISVVFGICIYFVSRISKRIVSSFRFYKINIRYTSLDDIINALSAEDVCNEGYVSFHAINKFSCRVLVQYIAQFSKNIVSKQRKKLNQSINLKYNVNSNMSIFEALSKFRINIIVCENANEELYKYINSNVSHLLSRNESILQVAIILDESVLLFPNCPSGLSVNQISRYKAAANLLCDLLAR